MWVVIISKEERSVGGKQQKQHSLLVTIVCVGNWVQRNYGFVLYHLEQL